MRVEQLYPFPGEPLVESLKKMANLEEVVWAQEEPKNNGAWSFAEPFIEEAMHAGKVRPCSRRETITASASPPPALSPPIAMRSGRTPWASSQR